MVLTDGKFTIDVKIVSWKIQQHIKIGSPCSLQIFKKKQSINYQFIKNRAKLLPHFMQMNLLIYFTMLNINIYVFIYDTHKEIILFSLSL